MIQDSINNHVNSPSCGNEKTSATLTTPSMALQNNFLVFVSRGIALQFLKEA